MWFSNSSGNMIDTLAHHIFFHAEDGIRYRNVTGVQTCALPILMPAHAVGEQADEARDHEHGEDGRNPARVAEDGPVRTRCHDDDGLMEGPPSPVKASPRSEERRVGKEGGATGVRSTET